ncbi:MAG: chitobiase/beta-hexosaminidase C-terminal domain-containing protein [Lachnospiraceae bacterium]|nr:chitobiase/beta-hexosaminidase C-terminal domain-containing protein [Lachnospiraceae bacterium]
MKCANCGAELKVGCVYCSVCGKEAQIVPDYNELDDEYLKSLLEDETDIPLPQVQGNPRGKKVASDEKKSGKKTSEKKKNRNSLLVALILLAVLILLSISVVILIRNNQMHSFTYQYEKAVSYADQHNYTKAIQYLERALELEPGNTDAQYELAKIYCEREDYKSAEILLLQTISVDPSNEEAYQLLIELYETQKKYDAISSLFESVTNDSIKKLFTDYVLDKPSFEPQGGDYEEALEISISAPNGTTIYYTMDGSDPTEHGVPYTSPISLEEEGSYTIKATACDERGIYSEVEKEKYVIEYKAPKMATVTPTAGTYTEAISITVHVPDGAKAYYTWDGTTPTTESDLYTEPLELPEGNNILAILVVSEQGLSSPIAKYNYIYQP